LPTILLFFAAQNQQKTYAHFMHFPFFFFKKKTDPYLPKSKGVNTQIKRKTNCNHKVCCYLFRKHMIVILEGQKKKKTSKIKAGTLKVING